MTTRYKRRNVFVKKGLQGKLMLSAFFLFFGGSLLFVVLLALFSADTLTISYYGNDIRYGQTPFILVKEMLAANWILLAIGGTILVVCSMILSHRIAGPLYRFEKALDEMNDGDLSNTICLRDKDEGKELAAKINQFNTTLSQTIRAVNHSTEALDTLLDQAGSLGLPEDEKNDLDSLCWSMREHNRRIQAACSRYRPKAG